MEFSCSWNSESNMDLVIMASVRLHPQPAALLSLTHVILLKYNDQKQDRLIYIKANRSLHNIYQTTEQKRWNLIGMAEMFLNNHPTP